MPIYSLSSLIVLFYLAYTFKTIHIVRRSYLNGLIFYFCLFINGLEQLKVRHIYRECQLKHGLRAFYTPNNTHADIFCMSCAGILLALFNVRLPGETKGAEVPSDDA